MISGKNGRRYVLFMLVLAYLFSFVDRQILAILLPDIKAEFAVGDSVLGFLAGPAFALFYATLGIPVAILADRGNRRNLIAAALALWSGMTALSGMANSIVQLALARIAVGVGEAGLSPAAHSMISDLYPPSRRATAMGIFTLGISLGVAIAFFAGGWVADHLGWREAFLMVGAPGLVLALLIRFSVREPVRGQSESLTDTASRPSVVFVARFLLRRRAFLYLALGAAAASFGGYSVGSFFPSFLARSFAMSLTDIGIYMGLVFGLLGGLGFAGGGFAADRLSRQAQRGGLSAVAAAMLCAWLFSLAVYRASDLNTVLILFLVPAVLSNTYLAVSLAHTQNLVELRMRGVASAIMLFVLNIIGLGLGPQTTGLLSDALRSTHGDESMRMALLIVVGVSAPVAALCFFLASRHIDADLARVAKH